MAVSINQIAVDKCYVTSMGQVRRVLSIDNGKIKYEARGKTESGGSWGSWTTVGDAKFAADVDREVKCDWNPDYPERSP